jgi:hypothetical protein
VAEDSPSTFEIEPGRMYAVLNGDVVASTEMAPEQRRGLPDVLEAAAANLPDETRAAVPYPIAIFSGDSWQLLLAEPRWALRAACGMRAYLRSQSPQLDSRLVIGLGSVDFVPDNDLGKAEGEAFRISGRALPELRSPRRMTLRTADGLPGGGAAAWRVAVELLDVIIQQEWTEARANVVWRAMQGGSQEQIAGATDVDQGTISKHLRRAQWDAVDRACAAFEGDLRAREIVQ